MKKESISLFFLRFVLFLSFFYHGTGILFDWFDGLGIAGFAGYMHFPIIIAVLVGIAETTGSLAMISGILTRIGALNIMLVMLGAIFILHLPHGFNILNGGYEYALTEFVVALSIFIMGPGEYTLTALITKNAPFILQ
ncbi:MAG: DoxX family protein [Candidatus Acidulodesulfobacterium ferriphilum]|jgi:putative oxidoreductase|uniref:DoxX family protein n=1 Tax=Candidatus Acidulodesulfobacterium ferriphilum TaxID=2597223 RepID=A0A519BCP8_9DELT|nr:MAG: DoxX family protein [Candidatus Acidulodesulfobacterium ferriphilum]